MFRKYEEPKTTSIFPGAKAIKQALHGLTAHQLRAKIAKLVTQNQELDVENTRLKREIQRFVPPDDYAALHKRAVALEQENRALSALVENIRHSLNAAPGGDWVIGNVADLPEGLQPYFGLINDAQAAAAKARDFEAAIHGFEELWRRVDMAAKRKIIADCDRCGVSSHFAAVQIAARLAKEKPERKPVSVPSEPKKGQILPFAKPGDPF